MQIERRVDVDRGVFLQQAAVLVVNELADVVDEVGRFVLERAVGHDERLGLRPSRASAAVMNPSSAMSARTTLRRSRARSGLRNGERRDGDWMMPGDRRRLGERDVAHVLPKKTREASETPWISNGPRWPSTTSLRYSSRIWFFVNRDSSTSAMNCSWSLRRSVFSGVRNVFLTICCVIVLPPTRYGLSPRMLVTSAPSAPIGSTPGCS